MGKVTLKHEASTPAAPAAGYSVLFTDSVGAWLLTPSGAAILLVPTAVVATAVDYTAAEGDGLILVDASTGPVAITLPPGRVGPPFRIKASDATNTVTIDGDGAETIDGTATITLATGEVAVLYWDGAEWRNGA